LPFPTPPLIRVALTGNIASGKSTVAALFRRWGATVIDADQLVREVQRPGTPALTAIAHRFGQQVLLPDGSLDRAALRRAVLADRAARHDLEAIVHPAVQRLREQREAAAAGATLVVHDIPLLFEALDPAAFDVVVLVDAPEQVRLARLVAERGMPEAEARALIAMQIPAAEKKRWRGGDPARGPLLIENDGDQARLEHRAREVWRELGGA
ncbi:MAG: dephospho-CoA kinase, partial [Gemmatimonadales bacterium]